MDGGEAEPQAHEHRETIREEEEIISLEDAVHHPSEAAVSYQGKWEGTQCAYTSREQG